MDDLRASRREPEVLTDLAGSLTHQPGRREPYSDGPVETRALLRADPAFSGESLTHGTEY